MTKETPLLYEALGPLTLHVNGQEPLVVGGRDGVVLSVLLLNAGRVVTSEYLIDAVWGDKPPRSARAQVHGCTFRLRRLLSEGTLRTSSTGYRLQVAEGEFDVTIFERIIAEGRAAIGQGKLASGRQFMRQGLALWRGPAFATVTSPVVRAEAVGLDELRLAMWEECIETELRMGGGRELVGELTTLADLYPLREELRRQLMVALYRAGRQADALAAYRQARADLAEELGVEPSQRLNDVHDRVLRGDVGLLGPESLLAVITPSQQRESSTLDSLLAPRHATAALQAAQLPVDVRGFVGRGEELALLDSILAAEQQTGQTEAAIAVITGTAGVGKTTLAVHWAHRMRDQFPDGQLYGDMRGFDPNGMMVNAAEAIQDFLYALGMAGQQVPAGLAAQAALYRSLLAGRRVLVVLDNVSHVDQTRPLLPGSPGCAALVTSRDRLMGLVAREGASLVSLDLVSTAEARRQLAARLGSARVAAEPEAVDQIICCCARLPLALAIAAARAVAQPDFPLAVLARDLVGIRHSLDALDQGDAAIDIRATFSCSYRTLSPEAARMFRLFALYPGTHLTREAAASLAGLSRTSVSQVLAELSRAHLITEHASGKFDFHGLLWAYAMELVHAVDPGSDREAAMHRMFDHYLRAAYDAAMLIDPHRSTFTLAGPLPGVQFAQFASRDEAFAWFAAERPTLLAIIQQAARMGFDAHSWQIAWALADDLFFRADWHGLTVAHRAALDAATRLGDPVGMAHAHRGLAGAATSVGQSDDAYGHLRQALSLFQQAGRSVDEAHILRNLGLVMRKAGRFTEALELLVRALELCQAAGSRPGYARTLNGIGSLRAMLGDYQQALIDCQQALCLFEDLDDIRAQGEALHVIGYCHHHSGHYSQAASCYQQALDRYRRIGDRSYAAQGLIGMGEVYIAAGAFNAARAIWRDASQILAELAGPDADSLSTQLKDLAAAISDASGTLR
jgi:DNA-binding SARP family transcriptional activator/tetratricopeptide (TPR) repeat protein